MLPVALLGVWVWGCGPTGSEHENTVSSAYETVRGGALGTGYAVTWAPVAGVSKTQVVELVDATLARIDVAMSTWRDDSELSVARRADGPVPVSEETAGVVRDALALAEATGGAFDPTVQPLMELWGFMGTEPTTWPSDAEILEVVGQVGWSRVSVSRAADASAVLDTRGTALDLSAIAKGYAVDQVAQGLAHLGIVDLFVEVGGEVRVFGRSPRGGAWRVGVERPEPGAPAGALIAGIEISNEAVATSGNYRRRRFIDGVLVHHTIDPRTGRAAEGKVISATVMAPDCQSADGWATALMVLGREAGFALLERRPGLEAVVVEETASGDWAASHTSGVSEDRIRWLGDDVGWQAD